MDIRRSAVVILFVSCVNSLKIVWGSFRNCVMRDSFFFRPNFTLPLSQSSDPRDFVLCRVTLFFAHFQFISSTRHARICPLSHHVTLVFFQISPTPLPPPPPCHACVSCRSAAKLMHAWPFVSAPTALGHHCGRVQACQKLPIRSPSFLPTALNYCALKMLIA